jgi:drug/metabolite transporter (DMT)-like permease
MSNNLPPARRLVLLRGALLALSVLASAAVVAVAGFAVYLVAEGYSGGSDPQSVAPLAFPLSFLVLVIAGLPASVVCAAAWAGYSAVARKSRRSLTGAGAEPLLPVKGIGTDSRASRGRSRSP